MSLVLGCYAPLNLESQCPAQKKPRNISDAGTRTRVAWVKARYPNQLDYIGSRVLSLSSRLDSQFLELTKIVQMTLVGLEPTISGSVDRCLIHWATGPLCAQIPQADYK